MAPAITDVMRERLFYIITSMSFSKNQEVPIPKVESFISDFEDFY
jgi:hypothetical protein